MPPWEKYQSSQDGPWAKYGKPSEPEQPHQAADSGGVFNALTTRDLDNATLLDPIAQTARLGQYANRGNQDLAGIIAEQSGQREAALSARDGVATDIHVPQFLGGGSIQANAIPGVLAAGTLATASEFLMPQNRLGAASLLISPLMQGYKYLRGASTGYSNPGIAAQLWQARTKVPAGDIQQAINDPSVWDAPSVAEGNAAYGKAAGTLQGAARSLRSQTGKVLLGEADWSEAINRPGRILAGTELVADSTGAMVPAKMDPQTALEGIQSINRFTRNKANTAKLDKEQIGELLKQKDALLTFLENNGTPGMREAALTLRKAHVKENLSRIMPQNKFGGTDALRTMGAGATAAGAASLALAGHPIAAIPLAAEAITASPAFLGGAIRNYQALSNPAVIGSGAAAIRGESNLEKQYRVLPKR